MQICRVFLPALRLILYYTKNYAGIISAGLNMAGHLYNDQVLNIVYSGKNSVKEGLMIFGIHHCQCYYL